MKESKFDEFFAVIVVAIIFAFLTVGLSFGGGSEQDSSPQTQPIGSSFSAIVKPDKAVFSLPVPQRRRWVWRRTETKDNAQEYRMDVSVTNDGKPYTFGFYLWKRSGAAQQSGDLESLILGGQSSVFGRTEPRRMSIIRDAGIKLKLDGERLTITIHGRDSVARLFSSRPAEAIFKITVPDEPPVTQMIAIVYQD